MSSRKLLTGRSPFTRLFSVIVFLLCASALMPAYQTATLSINLIERYQLALKEVRNDLKKNYYDPKFHGVDIDKSYEQANEKLSKAQLHGQAIGIIAQFLLDLNDSHTFLIPPPIQNRFDYGIDLLMVGNDCLVTGVKKGSDAEAKGVKPGDTILTIEGYQPVRENFWEIEYLIYSLRPRERLEVSIKNPAGQPRQLTIQAKKVEPKNFLPGVFVYYGDDDGPSNKFYEVSQDLIVWKMSQFDAIPSDIDGFFNKKVQGHKDLIVDLRGNPGGYVVTVQKFAGNFFDHDAKIADVVTRNEKKPYTAKTRGKNTFTGKVIVLVDGGSASGAEVFARFIQLEKRGTVIGDRTEGAVMESKEFENRARSGLGFGIFFAESITVADLIMNDGKSLEHVGVIPDEMVLPTPADLATRRDPVLSRAAALLGATLDPVKAGTLYTDAKKK